MFGIGGSEILVILVVALLFLGPDKLPEAAKQISKGIRDLKQQSRILQRQIENDETIGGAIRDLKSALNGDEAPARPPVRKQPVLADGTKPTEATEAALESPDVTPEKMLTMPPTAGEPDPDGEPPPYDDNHDELGRLIRSPQGTVAKNAAAPAPAVATAETPAKAETPAPSEPTAATTATPTQKHG